MPLKTMAAVLVLMSVAGCSSRPRHEAARSGQPAVVRAVPLPEVLHLGAVGPILAPGTLLDASAIGPQSQDFNGVVYGLADRNSQGSITFPAISRDGGHTWRVDGPLFWYAAAQAANVTTNITALSATTAAAWGGGVFIKVTRDGGRTWYESDFGCGVKNVTVDHAELMARVYNCDNGTNLYKSADNGLTWTLES